MNDRYFGTRKGSKVTTFQEVIVSPTPATDEELILRYDKIDAQRKQAVSHLVRLLKNSNIHPGDEIPPELAALRREIHQLENMMHLLATEYPWIV